MTPDPRKFTRQGEEARRDALIAAALAIFAQAGPAAATVRAIAAKAGVTPGLIRHYFSSKDALNRAAYRSMMEQMTAKTLSVLDGLDGGPEARLALFVASSLRPPVVDAGSVGLWASFLHMARQDPLMRDVHKLTYLQYRDLLQGLIAALPRRADAAQLRADAIACNAVIDGLWLEGSVLPEAFAPDELEQIGLRAIGAILGLPLAAHLPNTRETA
ncbi:MAG: AcrR family transcriptional regulator [Pseudorhodobacter sp.]|jgi:TetR/AcrR family transcriptional repressor of bet genes